MYEVILRAEWCNVKINRIWYMRVKPVGEKRRVLLLVATYQDVPSAVLHSGIQVVMSHFLLWLDLLHQPLWIGDLSGSVPAVRLPCWGKPVPHASILHWAPVHTCVEHNRDTHYRLTGLTRQGHAWGSLNCTWQWWREQSRKKLIWKLYILIKSHCVSISVFFCTLMVWWPNLITLSSQ